MLKSWLPPSEGNLFQKIKMISATAQSRGVQLLKLSIGQPEGPAIYVARKAASEAIMSNEESMHEYQDNGSPGIPNFAIRFVQCHVKVDLEPLEQSGKISFLPIPGIKPMLGLIPIACGQTFVELDIGVATLTDPGYPTPKYWCTRLGSGHMDIKLHEGNNFLFDTSDLGDFLESNCFSRLLMLNYPHNPSGKAATKEWLENLCRFCVEHHIRLFNDAAYSILDHSGDHCTLADVAVNFPDLSWAEAYSASKAGNFTGWRIGAMVGSTDFIADIARIKGDTDSGFAAPLAVGILHLFENRNDLIINVKEKYSNRIDSLIKTLQSCGMKLAVQPDAGFFTLWQAPKKAFGKQIASAEEFNMLMIEETGIVGVPFGTNYIRYAVASAASELVHKIKDAFERADVSY